MKRTFWLLTSFILITFLTMGIYITHIAHNYLHSILEDSVHRDLEMMATISQGALVSNDYERIEEEIMLWGEKDLNIIKYSMSLGNDAPLIEFVRDIQTEYSDYFVHSIHSPAGMQVNFEIIYDLSDHHMRKFYISLIFFSFVVIITVVFILSLWMILQRFAFRPLQNEILVRKKAVEDLLIAKEKAEESDRLKSAFLANMSHEIRTPMNGIIGFAELLKEPKLSGYSQKKYLNIIEESGERMLNIINDLMNISKIESGQMGVTVSEINVNAQLDYLFSFFKPETEKRGLKLSLVNTLKSKEVIIISDQEKLYAILFNLIKNAIKYTKEGSIEFGFSFGQNVSTVSTSSVTEGSPTELEFYVKDTGIGIPTEKLNTIFERFVQADLSLSKPYEGVGLGLSIARAYVLLLGGKIWVKSDMDKGSQFYFSIPYNPVKKENSSTNIPVLEAIPDNKVKKLKVLIVDDEEVSNNYLTILVEDIVKEILHAENGVKAVEICQQNHDIDLVLMDIKMPEMSGYEATRLIREFNKDVVIIAQTAFALMGDREKALEAGCNDYISKPINQEKLFTMIEKHILNQVAS